MCIVIIIIIFIIFTLQYISKKSSWFLNHKWKDVIIFTFIPNTFPPLVIMSEQNTIKHYKQ